jgi:hypothetical protein
MSCVYVCVREREVARAYICVWDDCILIRRIIFYYLLNKTSDGASHNLGIILDMIYFYFAAMQCFGNVYIFYLILCLIT